MDADLARRSLAELGGTALLLGAAVGGGQAASANGAPPYMALVIGTLAAAATLFTVLHAIGPLSGGHVNPAVTISMLATGNLRGIEAGAYIVAQVIGGVIGAASANALWESTLIVGAGTGTLSLPMYGAEVVATAGLVGAIHAAIHGGNEDRLPMIVPAAVMAASFAAPFGMANPAVSLGAGLVAGSLSLGSIAALATVELAVASVVGVGVAVLYRTGTDDAASDDGAAGAAFDVLLGSATEAHQRVVGQAIKASIRTNDRVEARPDGGWTIVFASGNGEHVDAVRHRIEAMVQLALVGTPVEADELRVGLAPASEPNRRSPDHG